MTTTVLVNTHLVGGDPGPRSLLVERGLVAGVDDSPRTPAGADVLDLEGRFVVRGLWDHHVHLDQWALARRRVDLSGCRSADECCEVVRRRVHEQPAPDGQPLIGHGFRDALWPDAPSLRALDDAVGRLPVVLLSHDLHSGWLNSAGFTLFGLPPDTDGLLRESAFHTLLPRLGQVAARVLDDWVRDALRAATVRGVTGVVDFEMGPALDSWTRRLSGGAGMLRVEAAVYPEHLASVVAEGRHTGDVMPGTDGLLTVGPLKLFLDGSLNARTAYCHQPYPELAGGRQPHGLLLVSSEELVQVMREARVRGLHCAVHAIGDRANTLALDGFAESSARGSVEHAQLLCREDLPRFAALGVAASVQPGHVVGARDVADRYWRARTGRAFAYASLLDSGAELRFGSDAPVSPLDPWRTIAAAVRRSDDDRSPWHPEQQVSVAAALAASTRGRYTVRVGDRADLVVLDRDPLTASVEELLTMPVHATMLGGRWTWHADRGAAAAAGSGER